MAELIYLLCGLTSLVCTILLVRSYRHDRSPLLMWCCVFFIAQTLTNILLIVDLMFLPAVNLFAIRNTVSLLGISLLVYGLIWELI